MRCGDGKRRRLKRDEGMVRVEIEGKGKVGDRRKLGGGEETGKGGGLCGLGKGGKEVGMGTDRIGEKIGKCGGGEKVL